MNVSDIMYVTSGVLQGSILRTLLIIIYIIDFNGVSEKLNPVILF